jgi:hypothetical protein
MSGQALCTQGKGARHLRAHRTVEFDELPAANDEHTEAQTSFRAYAVFQAGDEKLVLFADSTLAGDAGPKRLSSCASLLPKCA